MEGWWNENSKGKLQYLQENLSQWHSVQRRSNMDWPSFGFGPHRWEVGYNRV